MGIIGWILLGLVAGLIAKLLVPGRDPGGLIVTTLVGIAGAIVGGIIANALHLGSLGTFFELRTWIVAILGSAALLVVFRMLAGGRRRA